VATILVYNTRSRIPLEERIDVAQLEADMRYAIARFSNSEQRLPAAIVLPLQVARNLDVPLTPLVGGLFSAGLFDAIPLLAREAYLDPLFVLL
jgi:hypothetical protein